LKEEKDAKDETNVKEEEDILWHLDDF